VSDDAAVPTGPDVEYLVALARQAAKQAVREAPIPSFRPATSVGGDPGQGVLTVILDGDDVELTFPCLIPLPPVSVRVMVCLTPPSSGFIVGLINGNQELPVGSVVPWAGAQGVTPGWLVCNGAAYPKELYPALHGVLGTTYGGTTAGTTFNVPDLRGRVIAGIDDGAARLAPPLGVIGATGGSHVGTLITHSHSLPVRFLNPGQPHGHAFTGGIAEGANPDSGPATAQSTGLTGAGGASLNNTNLQPTMTLRYLIKA
jgi:microcystin-dependent protein